MNLFFCDIIRTFNGNENRSDELQKFVQNILRLIEIDQTNSITFSFISSDTMDTVKQYMEELKPHLNNQIQLGFQFSNNEIYYKEQITETSISSKLEQIIFTINKLSNIKKIYYADDSIFNQMVVSNILKDVHPEIELISFVPGTDSYEFPYASKNSGLVGLNESINEFLNIKENRNSL